MNPVKYLFYCLRNMDYSAMRHVVRQVSEASGKSTPGAVCDMIWCGLRYQAGYNDYRDFDFFCRNHAQRKTCNTRGKNNAIVRRYNDKAAMARFEDKGWFYANYAKYLHREWLDLRNCSEDDFAGFAAAHPVFIAKVAASYGGKGVSKINAADYPDLHNLYSELLNNNQTLVETVIQQHPDLDRLYPHGVNTMRLFTFYDGQEGHLLQAVLKLGNHGSFLDNFSSGGMFTFLDQNGVVKYPAVDGQDNIFETHPMTGQRIPGFQVPLFQEAVRMVEEAASVTPEAAYIGWDVAVSPEGPLIVEGNEFPGVFEPKARFLQPEELGCLAVYKNYMDVKL